MVAAALLIPAADLRPISALLPAAMLIALMGLSAVILIVDQCAASAGEEPRQVTTAPLRALGAFLLIVGYTLSTEFIGFYVSTAVAIPLVAYVFGYRSPLGLLAATVIVLGTIYLIFDFGMSQNFPVGLLWEN